MDWVSDYAPYWGIVLALPFVTKLFLIIPFIIRSNKRLEKNMPYISDAMREMHEAKKEYGSTDREKYKTETKRLLEKYGFNPYTQQMKLFIPAFIQIPIHLTLYCATRTMYPNYPNLKIGGTLWFSDLSMPDSTYFLPSLCAASMIASTLILVKRSQSLAQFQSIPPKYIGIAGVAVSACFIPISAQFSAVKLINLVCLFLCFLGC